MASEVELALKALIQKLDRRIARAESRLEVDRKARDEAYGLYSTLTGNPSVAKLKAIPKAPPPQLHQAVLLAASDSGESGVEFKDIVAFVEEAGVTTSQKSVRATAHRLQHEGRLSRKGDAYLITRSGAAKLATLQAANPIYRDVTPIAPKKDGGRARRPGLALR